VSASGDTRAVVSALRAVVPEYAPAASLPPAPPDDERQLLQERGVGTESGHVGVAMARVSRAQVQRIKT
jgi:hypothetical protein